MLDGMKIAFVGGGVMCEAIIKSLMRAALTTPDRICVAEPVESRRAKLAEDYQVRVTPDNGEAVQEAQIVVLSVKPQVMNAVLRGLHGSAAPDALVISIAAGVPIRRISDGLGSGQPIVRVMPNTPAQIGEGMSAWTCTASVTEAQRDQARAILRCMGKEQFVADEHFWTWPPRSAAPARPMSSCSWRR